MGTSKNAGRPRREMMDDWGTEIFFAPAPDGHGAGRGDLARLPNMRTENEWRFALSLRRLAKFARRFDLAASRRAQLRFGPRLAGRLTASQVALVRYVRSASDGASVASLATEFGVVPAAASRHASSLEKTGLVQKRESAGAKLQLTRLGKEIADWIDSEEKAVFYNLIAKLEGGYERAAFHKQLWRLGTFAGESAAHEPVYMADEDVIERAKENRRRMLGRAEPDYTRVGPH